MKTKKKPYSLFTPYFTFHPQLLVSGTFGNFGHWGPGAGGTTTVVVAKLTNNHYAAQRQSKNIKLFAEGFLPPQIFIEDSARNGVSGRSVTLMTEHILADPKNAVSKRKYIKKGCFDFAHNKTEVKISRTIEDVLFNKPGSIEIVAKEPVGTLLSESKPLRSSLPKPHQPKKTALASISQNRIETSAVEVVKETVDLPSPARKHYVGQVAPGFYDLQLEPLPFEGSIAYYIFLMGFFYFVLGSINRIFNGNWWAPKKLTDVEILNLYINSRFTYMQAVLLLKKHCEYTVSEASFFLANPQGLEGQILDLPSAKIEDFNKNSLQSEPTEIMYTEQELNQGETPH